MYTGTRRQRSGDLPSAARFASERPHMPRQLKASTSRGAGNANLSNPRKGEKYAGYNDDKRIATASGECDEWPGGWRWYGDGVYGRTDSGTGSGTGRPVRSQ